MAGAPAESTLSMTHLDKKSTNDLDNLSIEDGINGMDEDGILPGDSHVRGSGMFGTVSNLVNTIIGSGVLALPSCAAKVGWLLAVIFMVLSAGITWVGLHFLTACAHRLGGTKTSFGAAAAKSYPWMIVVVDFCVFAVTFGVCVAYMTIAASILPMSVKQFAPTLEPESFILQNWVWLLIAWVLFAMPLSMLKSVKILGYTSAIAVLCVLYTTVIVIVYSTGLLDPCDKPIADGMTCKGEIVAISANASGILTSIPVFLTAFCCAPSVFNIYNDIKKPSTKRLDVATISTMAICTALYLIIAMCGYFTYGGNVAGNILDSFPVEIWATIARIGTAFVVTVSYPLLMHPARDAVVHAITVATGGKASGNVLFYTVAAILNVAALGLAYFNVPLDLILSITGSIGVVNLSLTIPFIFYYKMFEDINGFKRMICIPGAVLGLAASVVCAYYSIAPLFA
uniref:LOC100127288 protein n=1 Tax=Xenopus laevis TaxID=8355 RepID=A9JS21_XENLA|nr:uncharacterized protein LOC100127288 [Xenopus laevis]AAI55885.1 LOC100127288 protein [Xenopus laevis]